MINVAVSDDVAIKGFCPNEVVHIFHALQIHGETLDTVGDFAKYRGAVDTADLLEVGELGYFHAVEPNLPTQTPSAESRIFPVVFDKADVVYFRVDTQFAQGIKVEVLNIGWCRFERNLELIVVLQAVGVVAIAAVFGAAAGLNVSGKPRLRA